MYIQFLFYREVYSTTDGGVWSTRSSYGPTRSLFYQLTFYHHTTAVSYTSVRSTLATGVDTRALDLLASKDFKFCYLLATTTV